MSDFAHNFNALLNRLSRLPAGPKRDALLRDIVMLIDSYERSTDAEGSPD